RRLRDVNGCRPELHVAIRPAHNQRPDNAARELPFNRAAKQKVRLAGEGARTAKGPRTRPAESACAERPVDQSRALLTIDCRSPAKAAILLNAGGCMGDLPGHVCLANRYRRQLAGPLEKGARLRK